MYFITFEGIDGCGKSLFAKKLYEYIKSKKIDCILTREPGGDYISEKIRSIILDPENDSMNAWAEALLYISSRAQHLNNIIIPALNSKKIVICERFSDSTNAYQGYARNLGMELTDKIQKIAFGSIEPNLTIYLDIDIEESINRIKKRNSETNSKKDRIEKEEKIFFDNVIKGYKKIINSNKKRIIVIDGKKNIDDITKEIQKTFDNLYYKSE